MRRFRKARFFITASAKFKKLKERESVVEETHCTNINTVHVDDIHERETRDTKRRVWTRKTWVRKAIDVSVVNNQSVMQKCRDTCEDTSLVHEWCVQDRPLTKSASVGTLWLVGTVKKSSCYFELLYRMWVSEKCEDKRTRKSKRREENEDRKNSRNVSRVRKDWTSMPVSLHTYICQCLTSCTFPKFVCRCPSFSHFLSNIFAYDVYFFVSPPPIY